MGTAADTALAVALVLSAATACGPSPDDDAEMPRPIPPEYAPAADRALDYLETTPDEIGADVVAAVQIFGARTGDARATSLAGALRARLGPAELERYGPILDSGKPLLPAATLDGATPSATEPNPADADDRVSSCPEALISCAVPPECVELVTQDDRWGYVLTHQALWIVVDHWMECGASSAGIDILERRRTFGASLRRETEADAVVSDLYAERLAMLGELGFGSAIDPPWLDALVAAQEPDGCFPVNETVRCHPHPTGLALWALSHTAGLGAIRSP